MRAAKPRCKKFQLILLLLSIANCLYGSKVFGSDFKQPDTLEYILLPGVFRAPETGLGLGAGIFILSPTTPGTQGSKSDAIKIGAIYTEKKQFVARALIERFLNNHRDHILISTNVQKYPDSFFGTGGDTRAEDEEKYTSHAWDIQLRHLHEWSSNMQAGPQAVVSDERISDFTPAGMLAKRSDQNGRSLTGMQPMRMVGLGVLTRIDTRDDIQDPDKGWFLESGYIRRATAFGSDHEFNSLTFDLRAFIPIAIGPRPVRLGGNLVAISQDGEPPFQALAQLGGRDLLRGYFLGRFRDRKLLAFQTELRIPIGLKWGVTGYAGAGNVSGDWQDMVKKRPKPAWGAGLRYRISDSQRVNLRLDLASGRQTPNPSFYLSLAEAF
jgi:outer membrane protein assembly factor BamA